MEMLALMLVLAYGGCTQTFEYEVSLSGTAVLVEYEFDVIPGVVSGTLDWSQVTEWTLCYEGNDEASYVWVSGATVPGTSVESEVAGSIELGCEDVSELFEAQGPVDPVVLNGSEAWAGAVTLEPSFTLGGDHTFSALGNVNTGTVTLVVETPDMNCDGSVDIADVVAVILGWGSEEGDADGDGTTDIRDLSLVIEHWN